MKFIAFVALFLQVRSLETLVIDTLKPIDSISAEAPVAPEAKPTPSIPEEPLKAADESPIKEADSLKEEKVKAEPAEKPKAEKAVEKPTLAPETKTVEKKEAEKVTIVEDVKNKIDKPRVHQEKASVPTNSKKGGVRDFAK